MSVIEKKIYKCDICGSESEKGGEIIRETVSCYGNNFSYAWADIDMCKKCRSILRKAIWDNFAEITDDYGLSIKRKF